ncbi:MAG: hypothetical protein ACUBOA_07660 [Candidatus Loosdrechtia sp.]|uniref:hypothetical protein n=1 Tax=Candidatus Loosdrechtia sp. TaxID=3101272 RepID=UPI003A66F72D|nr:MAG: hypothetical protein QY305_15420 [Candidatus Jettenia sp. AMX2]WKZ22057.1 MAG: hypothetical protein QY305_00065 [Candidatus Jettenia sp. AMX2]
MAEFILNIIKYLAYIFEEVFWLKELFVAGVTLLVFLLARWISKFDYREQMFLYLGSFIGVICLVFNNIGYLSSNDKLKFIAPTSLFLLATNENRKNDFALFLFLAPYFIISYEFYRGFHHVLVSLIIHLFIIFFIVIAKENTYFSFFVSTVIGALYNLIGYTSPPSTDDLMANPALITLAIKRFGFYTKNSKYDEFLKFFWTVLVCFAYFGNWIFSLF